MIKKISRKINEIPPLSHSTSELMRLMSDPGHDVKHVIQIVECDSALTSRVLRVINSASLALVKPTTSIARAVSYLGDKVVLGIALDACTSGIFIKPLDGYESKRGALWDHNLRTAIASREMARFAKEWVSPDLAFTGGLLHDIGKAVLSEFLRGSAADILAEIDDGLLEDYLAAEQKRLGIDHSVVGYELAKKWALPSPLPDIIRHHHSPALGAEEIRSLIYAVHVGDIIAMMGGTGTGSDDMQYHLNGGFMEYLHVSLEDLERVIIQVDDEFRKTKTSVFGGKENQR